MSNPILMIDDILIVPIQEDLTDHDALQFQTDVLDKAAQTRASGIVIDITGLEVVDSFMARVLNDTAEMVRLLGLQSVICGMQPMVALALVEMGRKLIGVQTALDLNRAMMLIRRLVEEEAVGES